MPAASFLNSKFHQQLNAIKNNSRQHLQQLYSDNYKAVERYVLQNNGTEEEAKDVFQEAFIAVWRNIQQGKFIPQNENSLNGYLFRVGKNKWISHLRSVQRKKVVPLHKDASEIEEEPLTEDNGNIITAIAENFKRLGNNCREVLGRFYYNREPMKQIAESFGWTEATARNNKYRCIEKLKILLKDQTTQESE